MEFVTIIFVNSSGVPLNSTKPMLDGRIMGGNETDITSHPYMVRPLRCCSVSRHFEVFEQKRPSVVVMTKC
jgi:hypothetical protein